MAPKLYTLDVSPPCRAVYLAAAHLGIQLDHVEVNLLATDHLKPDFVKKNVQHTVPTLEDDDGKIIWDSHAIMVYLVSKYGKDDSLYPKDFYKRAVVDQRLHFDSGVLFPLLKRMGKDMRTKGSKTPAEADVEEVNQAYDFINSFLDGRTWIAGDNVTLGDFSVLSSVTSLDVVIPINASKYPNVVAWIKKAQHLPYYNVTLKGLDDFKAIFKQITP